MKTQPTPLYATNQRGEHFVIIGWREDVSTAKIWPLTVPYNAFGAPAVERGPLKFTTEAPTPPPYPSGPRPADAQTAILTRVPAWPDPEARPTY